MKKCVRNFIEQAEQAIAVNKAVDYIKFPEKFTEMLTKTLTRRMREAIAHGYWLNHLYVREIEAAYKGTKYCGRITLADENTDDDSLLRELLENFITSGDWHDLIPEAAIQWLETYLPAVAGTLTEATAEKVRDVVKDSLEKGGTLKERIDELRKSSDEILSMADNRIEAIARTEVTRADSIGRLISMKSNDDVIGVEFSAVMDDRTTEMCMERNGLVMRLDDPRLPENTPPLHVNCRSLLLSLTVHDYPDGLLTSHEFDEAKAGTQRPEDVDIISSILADNKVAVSVEDKKPDTVDKKSVEDKQPDTVDKKPVEDKRANKKDTDKKEAVSELLAPLEDMAKKFLSADTDDVRDEIINQAGIFILEQIGDILSPELMAFIGEIFKIDINELSGLNELNAINNQNVSN